MSTSVNYTATGSAGPYQFNLLELIEGVTPNNQIQVFVAGSLQTEGIHYTVNITEESISFILPYPTVGLAIVINRQLLTSRQYTYSDGSALNASEMNANYDHIRLLYEDLVDYSASPPTPRPATNIFELADVDQASYVPLDGQLLQYDSTTEKWKPGYLALTIDSLDDTNITGFSTGTDVLAWDGSSSKWKPWEIQDFRPAEQQQLWGSDYHGIAFLERPYVSNAALLSDGVLTTPAANEIPTVRDVAAMWDDVAVKSGYNLTKRIDDALDGLEGTALEAALLSAVEWKFGVRFGTWREYSNSTADWPQLNGPVAYGDTLPDGTDAILETTGSTAVTTTSGPNFLKNPNRRFLPSVYQSRVIGSFTIDPGSYLAFTDYTGNLTDQGLWVRDLGGLVDGISIRGWRANPDNDHILEIEVTLTCAQSTSKLLVLGSRSGAIPLVSDYAGTLGYAGVWNIYPKSFRINLPTAAFCSSSSNYSPQYFRVYGDRSLDASVRTTQVPLI